MSAASGTEHMPLTPRIDIDIIQGSADFERLAARWGQLLAASPWAGSPMRFEWMSCWWEAYSGAYSRPGGLRIISASRSGEIAGILPLYSRSDGKLCFLSTGEAAAESTCAEYLELLCEPEHETEVLPAISAALAKIFKRSLLCGTCAAESRLSRLIEGLPGDASRAIIERAELVAPAADISGGFEAYLGSLGSSSRQYARRLLRQMDSGNLEFSVADDDSAGGKLDDLAELRRLHQEFWLSQGQPGAFGSERVMEFHRLLAARMPAGSVRLGKLSSAGQTLAVNYGFLLGKRFEFYQSGVARESAACKSPGILLHLLMMRKLAGEGLATYDFLAGQSEYKSRLGNTSTPLRHYHLFRRNAGGMVHYLKPKIRERIGALAGRSK